MILVLKYIVYDSFSPQNALKSSLFIIAAFILILFVLLFVLSRFLVLLFLHEVIDLFLTFFKYFTHFWLRYWRISRIHLQLSQYFAYVILSEEKRCDIKMLSELVKSILCLLKFLRRLCLHWWRLLRLILLCLILYTSAILRCSLICRYVGSNWRICSFVFGG